MECEEKTRADQGSTHTSSRCRRPFSLPRHQPLHVIASGVASKKAVVLSSKGGHFKTLRELTECMRASMLLPGITGPMVRLQETACVLVDVIFTRLVLHFVVASR